MRTHLNVSTSIVTMLAALGACESPGSSTPCVATPDAACFAPDTFAPDTSDSAAPDATPTDSNTIELPDLADVTSPPDCIGDLSRCNANLIEQCVDGHFVATQQCTGASVCDNGACVTRDCSANEERCVDSTRQRCNDGDWSDLETCPFGCAGTECKPRGDGNCEDALACAQREGCLSDGHLLAECADNCARASVPAAEEPFRMVLSCVDECGDDIQCVLDWCIDDQVACYVPEHGNGSCQDLDGCVQRCGSDACVEDCYRVASVTAQQVYLRWNTCNQLACNGFACTQCNAYYNECMSP